MRHRLRFALLLAGLAPLGLASEGHGQGRTVSMCVGNDAAVISRVSIQVDQGSGLQQVWSGSLWATQKRCENVPVTARGVRFRMEIDIGPMGWKDGCIREIRPPRAYSLYMTGTAIVNGCREE